MLSIYCDLFFQVDCDNMLFAKVAIVNIWANECVWERNFHIPKTPNFFFLNCHILIVFFPSFLILYVLPTPSQLFLLLLPQSQGEHGQGNRKIFKKLFKQTFCQGPAVSR